MYKLLLLGVLNCLYLFSFPQKKTSQWVSTTQENLWEKKVLTASKQIGEFDVEVKLDQPLQTIEGFGTCFNELGWTSLSVLSEKDRSDIFRELFSAGVGANFTICRMPIGANDFSRQWYSYDETEADFELKKFSIANDLETLVPFIKSAQRYNPKLKIWASPWSPPTWMKYNKHYAMAMQGGDKSVVNGLRQDQVGREGTDAFIQEDRYFSTYSKYFSKFIDAYRLQGINISMVMPQNEFNSAQNFPSCTWTARGLTKFLTHLGPEMKKQQVEIFFGTMERANEKLVDTVLNDAAVNKYIKGIGFQWAGKEAVAGIHARYPNLPLYQTEQECGNGNNDWKYCVYTWELMKHYFNNGVSAYLYWNTSLTNGGVSRWGWKQNSLVSVDTVTRTYKYNYEYYLLKHLSHYVKPGAKQLATAGSFKNLLAFMNKDNTVVIVLQNESKTERTVRIKVGNKTYAPVLKPDSFNTLLIL